MAAAMSSRNPSVLRSRRAAIAAGLLAAFGGSHAWGGAAATPSPHPDGSARGPAEGPPAAGQGRIVAILAEDLRNGGVLGVAQGMREGARELLWQLHVLDAGGTVDGRRRILNQAMALGADGFALCGSSGDEFDRECRRADLRPPPTVGWHVGAAPGPRAGSLVATNVTTDPTAVARAAADVVQPAPGGDAGVVVFTDSRFEIATLKTRAMLGALEGRARTRVLEVVDLPISDSADSTPRAVQRLLLQHGARWTHALAINDVYFDHALPVLIAAGRSAQHVRLVSAGDGSASAFVRIRSGSFQVATVAEPLLMQGWQMLDDLNRLFSHSPVSRFVTPVTLVTKDTLAIRDDVLFDPDIGYRSAYRRLWFPGAVR
jgi:ribose transport system substrate-binding protein